MANLLWNASNPYPGMDLLPSIFNVLQQAQDNSWKHDLGLKQLAEQTREAKVNEEIQSKAAELAREQEAQKVQAAQTMMPHVDHFGNLIEPRKIDNQMVNPFRYNPQTGLWDAATPGPKVTDEMLQMNALLAGMGK